jgi:23S rRNA (cytidine1920-2'-O)/16S rRNA (cytidine1409-2'-O)-methyltransferase
MKKRADVLLVEKNLARSREKAKAMIIAGIVRNGDVPIPSPSDMLEETAALSITGNDCPYVSRGGLKLEKALRVFEIDLQAKTCLDVGCSTGGFTDCMLKNGARAVYAVDVGYGQFDWGLRNDKRVSLFERTNARYLHEDSFECPVDFVSIDVSFISLKLILPALLKIRHARDMQVVALIKPQFEAGREFVGKKGVVRDPKVHEMVIKSVLDFAQGIGFGVSGLTFSPVKGPNGNIEYLALLTCGATVMYIAEMARQITEISHKSLV